MSRSSTPVTAAAIAALIAMPLAAASADDGSEALRDSATMDGPAATQGATGPAPSAADAMSADAVHYTEEKLDAFAEAAIGVAEVRQKYFQQISQAPDEAAAETLAGEAQEKMIEVVERTEALSVEEYIQIGRAAQDDPAFAQHLALLLQEKTEMSPSGQQTPPAGD